MSLSLWAMTHGTAGLMTAYGMVQSGLLVGLARGRASFAAFLRSPLQSVPLTVVAASGSAALGSLVHASLPLAAGMGLTLMGATGYAAGRWVTRGREPQDSYRRGARVLAEPVRPRLASRLRGRNARGVLRLAGIELDLQDETKHFKLIGTTGTGKSTVIARLLEEALARGDRAIIADPDGGYLRRFYDPRRGDRILNPFEARSSRWDLFAELREPYDVEQLARALIPEHAGTEGTWRAYGRTFLSSVVRQLHEAGERSVEELWRVVVTAEHEELRTLLAGTPAQPFLDQHNARMFDSIRSVTSSAVSALEHIARQGEAMPLSVRDWVSGRGRDSGHTGVLFIPYRAGEVAALRSSVSAWMRLAIFEAMNGTEGDQRLWFVVDELDALGQIDGLKDALARLRKFGGRCVLGLQSIAQVSSTYGTGEAHTIVENCGNTVIFRCSGSEHGGTSQFASRLIGDREVLRHSATRSRRPTEMLESVSRSEHVHIEPAVMPAQIERLPDLSGFVKLASDPDWHRITVEPLRSAVSGTCGRDGYDAGREPAGVRVRRQGFRIAANEVRTHAEREYATGFDYD